MANNKGKKKTDRKTIIVRVVSAALAGLMLFSVVLAAVLSQVF